MDPLFSEGILVPRFVVPSAQEYAIDIEDDRILKLYKAAIRGDWETAEKIFKDHPEEVTLSINQLGETALHIATAAGHTEFVNEMVKIMSEKDLETPTKHGETAFFYAAVCGHTQTAVVMLKKNPNLATIRRGEDMLPIQAAALHGHRGLVHHIYNEANRELANKDCSMDVLIALIDCDVYGIATEMVSERPPLATQANNKGETALYALARKPQITCNNFEHKSLYNFLFRRRGNEFRRQGFELLKLVLQQVMSTVHVKTSELINRALFVAANKGNSEFLSKILHSNPDLAFEVDKNGYTIFHIAVLHRHVKIFNIIEEIDSIKNVIKLMNDKEGNNILHLAGKLPSSGLEVVPGAALQLQHELLWFEEVKKLVGPHQMEAKDKDGRNPVELFNEQHEDLKRKGEEWMKSTVNSCMVVSTLVAGVAFASSITVPGGNKGDTGIPNFLQNFWFKIFAISNGLSLILSASSILLFLTIFTSHYSVDDFKKSLPIKFILGLMSLSLAVETMVFAFIASFFIMFNHRLRAYAYPIAAIAVSLIIFLRYKHFPLFLHGIYSTLLPSSLFKGKEKRRRELVLGGSAKDFFLSLKVTLFSSFRKVN